MISELGFPAVITKCPSTSLIVPMVEANWSLAPFADTFQRSALTGHGQPLYDTQREPPMQVRGTHWRHTIEYWGFGAAIIAPGDPENAECAGSSVG